MSMFSIFLPCFLVSLPYFWIISCYMLLFSSTQLPILMFLLSLLLPSHRTLFYTQASYNNGVTCEFRSWVFQPRLHLNYLTWNTSLEHGYIWIPSDSTFLLPRLMTVNLTDYLVLCLIFWSCPKKQDLLSDLRCKSPGWACSSICRKCLFPCCAHRNRQNSWGRRWKVFIGTNSPLIRFLVDSLMCGVITGLLSRCQKESKEGCTSFHFFLFLLWNKVYAAYLLICQSLPSN